MTRATLSTLLNESAHFSPEMENPDWDAAERRPDMNHFMARFIFCFFAEDTDIFHRSQAPRLPDGLTPTLKTNQI